MRAGHADRRVDGVVTDGPTAETGLSRHLVVAVAVRPEAVERIFAGLADGDAGGWQLEKTSSRRVSAWSPGALRRGGPYSSPPEAEAGLGFAHLTASEDAMEYML